MLCDCVKTPELKFAVGITCPTDSKLHQEWDRVAFLHQLSSRLQSIGSSTTCPQHQVSKSAHVSSPILSMQTIPPFSSRLHQTLLNVCQASTARPQCSVCVFYGQKPNSRTLVGSGVHGHPSNITVDGNTVHGASGQPHIPRQHSVLQRRQSSWYNASHRSCVVMSFLQQVWKDRYLSLPTKIRVYTKC